MKRIFISVGLALSLMACGSGNESNKPSLVTNISPIVGSHIVWQGSFTSSFVTVLYEEYQATAECMATNFGIVANDLPTLELSDTMFYAYGYYTNGSIDWDRGSLVIFNGLGLKRMEEIVSHETIHWVSRKGNEIHYNIWYKTCSSQPADRI